jgi:hypothetical protein
MLKKTKKALKVIKGIAWIIKVLLLLKGEYF